MKKNIMYDLAHKETGVFKQMIDKPKVYLLRGLLTNNWSPATSHALEPTPLSEIYLLRIQAYSRPCSKLGDTCYTAADHHESGATRPNSTQIL
jgi:hypothetical protein